LSESGSGSLLAGRWAMIAAGLDVFWLLLALVLVGAVVLVASVAHTSMDQVGTTASQVMIKVTPTPTVRSAPPSTIVIVQVSSYTSKSMALTSAEQLIHHGIGAHVLESGHYRMLKRGFFVVYAGPYPKTSSGRADAKRTQDRIPGALIREIQPR
jgi:hypothetical protein